MTFTDIVKTFAVGQWSGSLVVGRDGRQGLRCPSTAAFQYRENGGSGAQVLAASICLFFLFFPKQITPIHLQQVRQAFAAAFNPAAVAAAQELIGVPK